MVNRLRNLQRLITTGLVAVIFLVACTNASDQNLTETLSVTASAASYLVSPTNTPTRLFTPTSLPTRTATISPTISMSPTPEFFAGPLVAIVEQEPLPPNSLLLFDVMAGLTRRLVFADAVPIDVAWLPSGCQLYITLKKDSDIELVRAGLDGKVLEIIFHDSQSDHLSGDIGNSSTDITWKKDWAVSPTGKQVAYIVGTGQQFYSSFQIQSLEVRSIITDAKPITISQTNGTLSFAWSPDGQYLAYSDYDDAGIRQMFIAKPDGSNRRQLTELYEKSAIDDKQGNFIGNPFWSPNGQYLAFSSSTSNSDGSRLGSIWIASSQDDSIKKIALENISAAKILGWDIQSATFVVYVEQDLTDTNQQAVYWIDAVTGEILHVLNSSDLPEGYMTSAFIVGEAEKIGIATSGNDNAYMYDAATGTLEKILNRPLHENLVTLIRSTPLNFPGEKVCMER